MNPSPAASISFLFASDSIPASATTVMSVSRCAAMNVCNVGTMVAVSALFPSNASTARSGEFDLDPQGRRRLHAARRRAGRRDGGDPRPARDRDAVDAPPTPRSTACATATPPSRSAPAPTCSTPPCDDDKTQRNRANASTSTRGRPAVAFTRTVTACVPVALHERTKTILAGCTVLAYRSTVPASTPSTYTVALPRLGPRTATQPTDRALAVNLAQASACVEPRT